MPRSPEPPPALLDARALTKRFPGVVALSGVDFGVRPGEVHALMGQNGAGKSTLIRILTGAERPDSGSMRLTGADYRPASPAEAQRRGVCAVYQEANLVPTLSIAENLFLGRQPRGWWGIRWSRVRTHARDAMRELGLDASVDLPVGSLPISVQQMAAVARAVHAGARVIVFDEPTSSLDSRETDRLFDVIRRLRSRGVGLVFITHFLDQVYRISDRITVLRNGGLVGTWPAPALSKPGLISAMLGDAKPVTAPAAASSGDSPVADRPPALRVRNVSKRAVLNPATFDAWPGEVLGLAGLLGSGRTETARLVFGADRPDSGSVELNCKTLHTGSPRASIGAGLAMTPEDRKADGLFLKMSIRDNIAIVVQRRLSRWGLLHRHRHAAIARDMVARLGIACRGIDQPAGTLSGGNQQKVLLARWLANQPRVLILDEPTRGVDIGAKAQIESIIDGLKREGVAVIFISAELDEVARRSTRILILRDRRIVGELRGPEISEDRIRQMIAGDAA